MDRHHPGVNLTGHFVTLFQKLYKYMLCEVLLGTVLWYYII